MNVGFEWGNEGSLHIDVQGRNGAAAQNSTAPEASSPPVSCSCHYPLHHHSIPSMSSHKSTWCSSLHVSRGVWDSLSVFHVQGEEGGEEGTAGNEGPPPSAGNADDDRLPHQRWQGRSTQFMRSNEHGRDRQGLWNTEGLQGAALALVKGDEGSARHAPDFLHHMHPDSFIHHLCCSLMSSVFMMSRC